MSENKKKKINKEVVNAGVATSAGAALGAGTYGAIGSIGIAAAGTATSVTLVPFIIIGAGLGAAVYGVFLLGKQVGQSKDSKKI